MLTTPPNFQGEFFTDLPTRAAYSEGAGPYRIVPRGVAVPLGLDDLRRLVDHASRHSISLTPRGAGSGIPGNNIGPGIVVDLARFDTPLNVSAAERVANVGAAVSWATLDREAGRMGLRLGPNPSSAQSCTIGGMVATNAAGARSLRAGSVRRWVRGVEMVTVDGEVGWFARAGQPRPRRTPVPGQERGQNPLVNAKKRFDRRARRPIFDAAGEISARFPRTRKNSSGYALDEFLKTGELVDLIIGSEGTLGIITRAALALEPVPGATASALVALGDIGALPEVVTRLLELEPATLELMDRSLLALAAPRLPFSLEGIEVVLLADFERDEAAAAADAIARTRAALGSGCVRLDSAVEPADREALWSVRHAASPALATLPPSRRSLQIIEDGCVPVDVLDRYLAGIRAAAARHRVEVVVFGHAGDGHLHVNVLPDTSQPDLQERLAGLLHDVTALVASLGGTPSGEHGDGRLRATVLEQVYGAQIVHLFAKVKRAFDPPGILNPGVIVPGRGADPLAHLKVGSSARKIPADIEIRLRELERAGRWSVPKHQLVTGAVPSS